MENKNIEDIKNIELIDAIRTLIRDESDENKIKMFQEVAKATFIAPVSFIDDKDVVYGQEEARQIRFDIMENGDGTVAFPVFSDLEELKRIKKDKECNTILTNAHTYAQMFADPKCCGPISGIIINPGGMCMFLGKDYFLNLNKQINNGMTQKKFGKDTKFSFSMPKEQPVDMLNVLKEYFKYREDVKKAYFLMMSVDDAESTMLLVIDTDDENPQKAFEGIIKMIEPFNKGREVAMVPYKGEPWVKATEKIEPFYVAE